MATKLTEVAREGGTYPVTVALTDENGDTVTPISMIWSLTDENGVIINSLDEIDFEVNNGAGAVGVLSASMIIVLNGDSIAISSDLIGIKVSRYLLVEGTFTSDLGIGLPFRDTVKFDVENLPKI